MLDAPSPVSTNLYIQTNKEVCEKSHQQALESMKNAREEIRKHHGAASSEEIVDILVSCDGTWQKRASLPCLVLSLSSRTKPGKWSNTLCCPSTVSF